MTQDITVKIVFGSETRRLRISCREFSFQELVDKGIVLYPYLQRQEVAFVWKSSNGQKISIKSEEEFEGNLFSSLLDTNKYISDVIRLELITIPTAAYAKSSNEYDNKEIIKDQINLNSLSLTETPIFNASSPSTTSSNIIKPCSLFSMPSCGLGTLLFGRHPPLPYHMKSQQIHTQSTNRSTIQQAHNTSTTLCKTPQPVQQQHQTQQQALQQQQRVLLAQQQQQQQQQKPQQQPQSQRISMKPKAKFVSDVTLPDGTLVYPNTTVTKTWRVINDGNVNWPTNTVLVNATNSKHDILTDINLEVSIPTIIIPNQIIELSIDLHTPAKSGRYVSYFRLKYKKEIINKMDRNNDKNKDDDTQTIQTTVKNTISQDSEYECGDEDNDNNNNETTHSNNNTQKIDNPSYKDVYFGQRLWSDIIVVDTNTTSPLLS